MKILFNDSNNSVIDFELYDTNLSKIFEKFFKHLQHVDIPFKDIDNPFMTESLSHEFLIDKFQISAKKLNISVDIELLKSKNQEYLNYLHQIYETQYNGKSEWLDFHELLHFCEDFNTFDKGKIKIDYRELGGPLKKPKFEKFFFNRCNKINVGEIYYDFCELGKIPFTYWKNNEPNNLQRICELAKPIISIRPSIRIALEDQDTQSRKSVEQIESFNRWWKEYELDWCKYHNITSWSYIDMQSKCVIGFIQDTDRLIKLLKRNYKPLRIKFN